ncbi:MAG: hypothetical protein U1A78_29530 [Polyangia bacterium]
MRKRSTSSELTDLIKRLSVIRREHERALDEIDTTFRELGIEHLLNSGTGRRGRKPGSTSAATKAAAGGRGKKRGRKPGPKPGAKRARGKRGSFAITGDELILRFVKKQGGPSTDEIRKHWESSGRGGKADNNLSQLVKRGLLVRSKIEGSKGSAYSLAPGVTVND